VHYVYVLQSQSDLGLYIGYTADLRRRLKEHQTGAATATAHRGPWRLIYYEDYVEEADARGREAFLKSGAGRRFLRKQLRRHFDRHPWGDDRVRRSLLRGGIRLPRTCWRTGTDIRTVQELLGHESVETA
jgi:putative endonuclease